MKHPNEEGLCPLDTFLCDDQSTTDQIKKYGICVDDDVKAKGEKSPKEYTKYMIKEYCPMTGIEFKRYEQKNGVI